MGPELVGEIEKAIQASELGLNPQSDGVVIRLPIPPLTEERRRDLVKVVKRLGEDAKVAIRNVRRDANEKLKKLEKEHEIAEDDMRAKQKKIQKLTDRYIEKVDEVVAHEGKRDHGIVASWLNAHRCLRYDTPRNGT